MARLTSRAPDVWDSAAFSSIFLASSFSCSQAESTPTHTQVTQTVSQPMFENQIENTKEVSVMKVSNITIVLAVIVALTAATAAAIGLFWRNGGSSYPFSTLRGQTVQIYGQGIYQHDTLFFGAGFKGQDAVVLFLGVPLLIITIILALRGSTVGQLLMMGILGYFLYVYASMALGASYNRLFLLYIIIFSASLFAFIQTFASVDLDLIATRIPDQLPIRGLAIFMCSSGLITLFVWGAPLVTALISGGAPERMDSYTTMVTFALDLAVITPATIVCAILVLKGEPLGYAISMPLLMTIILLAPQIILSTIFQKSAGVPFTRAEMVGPVTGFVILGLLATWLITAILKGVT